MLKSDQNKEDTLQRPSMCVASCFNHENTSGQTEKQRGPPRHGCAIMFCKCASCFASVLDASSWEEQEESKAWTKEDECKLF